MEKIFKARWWDYSKKKFNLNGRICGYNALLFGIASIVVLYVINPFVTLLVGKLSTIALYIISIIGLLFFLTDIIISCNIISTLKTTVNNIEIKDSTIEIRKAVKEILKNNHKIFQNRIINAFPQIKLESLIKTKKIKELLNHKK